MKTPQKTEARPPPPYTRVFRGRHRGPSHVHRVRVGVRLKGGRLIRKSRRFRTCPSR